MLVKCTSNHTTSLSETAAASAGKQMAIEDVNLVVGATYVVLGLVIDGVYPWFLVCEGADDDYPVAHISQFFEIVDPSVDPDWVLAHDDQLGGFAFLPRRWAGRACFIEDLVSGDKAAISEFLEIRRVAESRYRQ